MVSEEVGGLIEDDTHKVVLWPLLMCTHLRGPLHVFVYLHVHKHIHALNEDYLIQNIFIKTYCFTFFLLGLCRKAC